MKHRLKEDSELAVLDFSTDHGHTEHFRAGTEFTEIAVCKADRYRILGLGDKRAFVPESMLSRAFERIWEDTTSTAAPWRTADESETAKS